MPTRTQTKRVATLEVALDQATRANSDLARKLTALRRERDYYKGRSEAAVKLLNGKQLRLFEESDPGEPVSAEASQAGAARPDGQREGQQEGTPNDDGKR